MARLIAGLGNPGARYAATRHNLGFLVADRVAELLGLEFSPGAGPYLEAWRDGDADAVAVIKPQTFMNLSGRAIVAWFDARGPGAVAASVAGDAAGDPERDPAGEPAVFRDMLVVCDDLNLPLGAVRLRARGGSGGQNGLAHIIETLGTEEIPRLRLGIAPAGDGPEPRLWADFVLEEFSPAEAPVVRDMVEHAARTCLAWLEHGTAYAASRYNRRTPPPPPGPTSS